MKRYIKLSIITAILISCVLTFSSCSIAEAITSFFSMIAAISALIIIFLIIIVCVAPVLLIVYFADKRSEKKAKEEAERQKYIEENAKKEPNKDA